MQQDLSRVKYIGPTTVKRLEEHGITTVEQLAALTLDELASIPGVGKHTAPLMLASAQQLLNEQAQVSTTTDPSDKPISSLKPKRAVKAKTPATQNTSAQKTARPKSAAKAKTKTNTAPANETPEVDAIDPTTSSQAAKNAVNKPPQTASSHPEKSPAAPVAASTEKTQASDIPAVPTYEADTQVIDALLTETDIPVKAPQKSKKAKAAKKLIKKAKKLAKEAKKAVTKAEKKALKKQAKQAKKAKDKKDKDEKKQAKKAKKNQKNAS